MSPGGRVEAATERVGEIITDRPRTVIIAFLLLTAVFAGGMTQVSTSSGSTDSFTEDLPEQQALDDINEKFQGPFETDSETTQLIHEGDDVLTRQALLEMLSVLERVDQQDDLWMSSANGPAPAIAQAIDPTATTPAEQQRVIRHASDRELRSAIRALSERPSFERTLSDDFNSREAAASASITVITHDPPEGADEMQRVQTTIQSMADDADGSIHTLGSGIIDAEFSNVIGDSMSLVMPVVMVLLLTFLVIAYRDPIDLVLGLIALVMTIIWTFGFLGFAGIPFDQMMISVPVLLLAVGVDFGIHIINRYREETIDGTEPIPSMRLALGQLLVAFVIVTATTVFGFGANVVSDLAPIRRMGMAASVGIVFTFLIFGLFLPPAKIESDRFRERYNVPAFNSTPIASEDSGLGRMLAVPARISDRAPAMIVLAILVLAAVVGGYGAGVDNTFDTDDFLPPEEQPGYVDYLPASMTPADYTVTETVNIIEDRFATAESESVMIYVEGPFERAHALTALTAPNEDPPESFAVGPHGEASARSIVTVIQSYADQNPQFGELVERSDLNGDGIPDQNLERIYDELMASPYADSADDYLTEDRRAAKVSYTVDSEASQDEIATDASRLAEDFRYSATATGETIIFAAVSDLIYESAIQGLVLAIGLSALFLVLTYTILERKPMLGIVNVFPIIVAVIVLLATMRALGMSLNALTATILSISIGVGIAYSVHVTHRYTDEIGGGMESREALLTTLTGTGGALAGSMATTSLGTGALTLAISPILGDFGFLMALSVFYSFVASMTVLPPALQLWARWETIVG
ncbi:efflux RND transporter permease subunit [Halanaeroarchaeum sulfurireducens]|uniref:Putative RND superfamily exporter n=1 Tax=Halanaeroarchaeum sulfurireducens TaxID=1604004 RepID=A0A0F7PBI2_9EURY|nr:MMPL family transporter [Halanaeroarchaeum sulfurireducens]AKH98531.1 putative RND superfamily exporter [Halanaeroarchaeum sulfurireducens]